MKPRVSFAEVRSHHKRDDCWVVIHGLVYNLTEFLKDHPGGVAVIMQHAGGDATAGFDAVHPRDIIDRFLPADRFLGELESGSGGNDDGGGQGRERPRHAAEVSEGKPALGEMLNLFDFEAVARRVMSREGWAYYSSGTEDEIGMRENHAAFQRIWLKPRILVDVARVDTSTRVLGYPSSLPVYITATALGKLGHPDGEKILTRAAAAKGIIQMIPTLASCSLDEITGARTGDQIQFFQLYVNEDRSITEKLVKRAAESGCRAIFLTVDAPQIGRREKDMRLKYVDEASYEQRDEGMEVDRSQGAGRAISSFVSPSLCWKDIPWLRSLSNLPLVLKGVQTVEDALLAAKHGCEGIVLSNHGGRQVDYARSSIEILPEVMEALREQKYSKMAVFIDGGIRRASDIFKALALGAEAVGIGRPFLYAMSAYGQPGVERAIQILNDELEMLMRLMGTPTVADIQSSMVCTRSLPFHFAAIPKDYLSSAVYERLESPKSRL